MEKHFFSFHYISTVFICTYFNSLTELLEPLCTDAWDDRTKSLRYLNWTGISEQAVLENTEQMTILSFHISPGDLCAVILHSFSLASQTKCLFSGECDLFLAVSAKRFCFETSRPLFFYKLASSRSHRIYQQLHVLTCGLMVIVTE